MHLKVVLVKWQIRSKPDVDYVRQISSFLIWVKRHSLVILLVKSLVKEIKLKTFFKPANQKKIASNNTQFKSAENDNGSSSNSSTYVVDQSSKLVQPTLELATTNSDKTKAEIIWALKCIESCYPDNSNNDMNVIFNCIFPHLNALLYNFWLAPYFKSLLIDTLKKSDSHVLSFDESLNDFSQTSEMDLLVRFFANSTNTVNTRFYDSHFLGHATHQDLHKQFNNISNELGSNKLFQISKDGPSVNL